MKRACLVMLVLGPVLATPAAAQMPTPAAAQPPTPADGSTDLAPEQAPPSLEPATDRLEDAARVLAELAGSPVRPYSTRDFGREPYDGARSALVPESDAEDLLTALRARLPPGVIAFVGNTRSLADPPAQGVELVVAPGTDQFEILRVAASDAVNYGKVTADLIVELQAWDREFGIDIWQAETDTIQLRLRTMPKDLRQFARRVYEFCPDIVEQGTGGVAELAKLIARERGVYLWWD